MPPKAEEKSQQPEQKEQKQQEKEEKEEKEEVPQKQLRRVAERGEMPSDKAELIQYLSNRIKQAEEALMDTEELLEEEVKEREKVEKSLDERNLQLSKLYEVDQRALPEKIKQKLNEILTTTVTQKIEAEEQLQQQKSRNYEYKSRYNEIKWEDLNNKAKLEEQESKEKSIANDLGTLEAENQALDEELDQINGDYTQLKENKESLQDKYLQMKVALERMGDVKGVLNRFFGNEDLFDEKMELKEQKVVRPQVLKKETPLPPSREMSRHGNNTQKLKPISRVKNDDDDFWKADFKSKNSAY